MTRDSKETRSKGFDFCSLRNSQINGVHKILVKKKTGMAGLDRAEWWKGIEEA